jgi:hypothetical protein
MKCVGVGSENLSKANKIVKKTADFKIEDLNSL